MGFTHLWNPPAMREMTYTPETGQVISSPQTRFTRYSHTWSFLKNIDTWCESVNIIYIHQACETLDFPSKKKKKKELAKSTTLKLPRGFQGQSVRIPGLEAILSLLKLPFSWLHVQQCNQALYIVYYTVYLLLYIHYYASWRWTQPVHSY